MGYMKKVPVRRAVARTRSGAPVFAQLGEVYAEMGDYDISTPCTTIPAGDPYRVPGNSCTCPDGNNVAIFDSNGNVTAPDGSAACAGSASTPSGSSPNAANNNAANNNAASAGGSLLGSLLKSFVGPTTPGVVSSGPSTTEILVIGGVGLLVLMLATRGGSSE